MTVATKVKKPVEKKVDSKGEKYRDSLANLENQIIEDIKIELNKIGKSVGAKDLKFTDAPYNEFAYSVACICLDEYGDLVFVSEKSGVEEEIPVETVLAGQLSSWDFVTILEDLIEYQQVNAQPARPVLVS